MYESDEEFGTLPVITTEYVDMNLPSVKIERTNNNNNNNDRLTAFDPGQPR